MAEVESKLKLLSIFLLPLDAMHPRFAGGGCAALVSSLCSTVYITAEARTAEGVKDCGSLTLARHFFLYRGTRTAEFYNGGRLRRLSELVIEFNRLLYREVQTAEYY